MSVFGGDSWAREAQYRKRRVDDLVIDGLDGSSHKKLSSGKYACLVCPHNPVLESPLALSMHCKGSRHIAAASKLKEKELMRQSEINKRLALSESDVMLANPSALNKNTKLVSKPLIEKTKRAATEILGRGTAQLSSKNQNCDLKLSVGYVNIMNVVTKICENSSCLEVIASEKTPVQQHLDFRERRERELKFTEAGWKRDCHGRWFRDENVEFDSDEEDPNVYLG
ncbi:PREDICTED: sodium channel modifier 1-like [Populus euphratica]|uniref:Sodium channel modifier 1 n=1 Tax=Populus euphratica TaxID=75702 RepID=A0AAJ6SW09_POPEU|nr:PREDICTED: sodium channel modifier 1-like [Populus euphratica]